MDERELMWWFCLSMIQCVLFFLMGCAALFYRGKWINEKRRTNRVTEEER